MPWMKDSSTDELMDRFRALVRALVLFCYGTLLVLYFLNMLEFHFVLQSTTLRKKIS